jgi:hypothetical protein
MGARLVGGLGKQAAAHGVPVRITGPEVMPYLTFDADDAVPRPARPEPPIHAPAHPSMTL